MSELPPAPGALPAACIDAHTHLDHTIARTGLSVADNIAAAAAVGIERLVHIACDVEGVYWADQIARTHDEVVAAIAIHPNDAARMDDVELSQAWEIIDRFAGAGSHIRAIGETGMDRFRTTDESGIAQQRESFARHIDIAKRHDLALAIHDRETHDDVLDVLNAEGWPERVIFHCFSGDADFARACLDHGAWLSFAGNVTYKANRGIQDALAITPADKLLIETDAPFLTPMPHRGKLNAPYLLPHTVEFAATHRGDALIDLCRHVRHNTEEAYGGPWGGDYVSA